MKEFGYPYNITDNAVVVMVEQKTFTVNSGDDRYEGVRDAIRSGDEDGILRLLDVKGRLVSESNGGIYLLNGMLRCDKYDIPTMLATRIVAMFQQGFSTVPLTLFLENLMENPNESGTIVEELYGFIEHSNLPLTLDGHFLAYKMVRPDFKDLYSGTMDNSVGQIVEMPRIECDFSRTNPCSSGLHFCSEDYLGGYGTRNSDQVVIVKVNPRDVTSIPGRYSDAKGRACKYEIVEAISWDELITPLFTADHSEPVENNAGEVESGDTPERWELRNSNDDTLINSFVTRQGARDARSGNASLYIVDTESGEVVAGVRTPTPQEVDDEEHYDTSAEEDTSVKANPGAVLDERTVSELRKILDGGHYETIVELALMYGVSERTIRRIRDRDSWKHVA